MKKLFALAVSATMLLGSFGFSASAAPAEALGPNLVVNGDFENTTNKTVKGTGGWKDLELVVPTNFELAGTTKGDTQDMSDLDPRLNSYKSGVAGVDCYYYDITTDSKFQITGGVFVPKHDDGNRALYLNSYLSGSRDSLNVWSDEMPVTAGKTYRLTSDVFSGGVYGVGIRFFDAKGNVFQNASAVPFDITTDAGGRPAKISNAYSDYNDVNTTGEGKHKWFTRSRDFIAPVGAVKARVIFGFLDSGKGVDGKFAVDNIKLQEVYSKKLAVKNGAANLTANANAVVADNKDPKALLRYDSNFVNITANDRGAAVSTADIKAYGAGKYYVRFDASAEEGAAYSCTVDMLNAEKASLATKKYALSGAGMLQTNEIDADYQPMKDITFDAPEGTAFLKLTFEVKKIDAVVAVDNIEAGFYGVAPEASDLASVNTTFAAKDDEGNLCGITFAKLTEDSYAKNGQLYGLVEYGMAFSKTNANPTIEDSIKVKAEVAKNVYGQYGVKYIGKGIVAGNTYYSRPYATYSNGVETVTVYGATSNFIPAL